MKKNCIRLFLLIFTFISVIAVLPDTSKDHNAGLIASELECEEKTYDHSTVYTFVDALGKITFAIDRGYASRELIKNTEGQVIKECYYDTDGNLVKLYNSYYGVAYEYKDHEIVIQYLDSQGKAMQLNTGYSTIIRTLDDAGRAIDDFYYDLNMHPIQYAGYYGIHRDYDEQGQNNRISYVDKNGKIILCSSGYAVKEYRRDEKGKLIGEFYYDAQGNPAESSSGGYGQLYEWYENGRISQITYLNADGDPGPTNAGYTILKRTYYRDGNADTDMYFDTDGNPIALSKGQYGIKHSGKITLLLDRNGNIMLCIDNILNGFPFMVIVFGCVICLCMLVLPKKMSALLTLAYVIFVFYETLMFRENGNVRANVVLFSYAGKFFKEQSIRVGVINNIWLFVPLGTGMYKMFRKKWVLLIPFIMSVTIETTQYITGLGIAEFDDVFGNTLGGWIGVLAANGLAKWINPQENDIDKKKGCGRNE